jgi:hypothetical protein
MLLNAAKSRQTRLSSGHARRPREDREVTLSQRVASVELHRCDSLVLNGRGDGARTLTEAAWSAQPTTSAARAR